MKGKRGQGSRKVLLIRGAHAATNYLLYWYKNTNADARSRRFERGQGSRQLPLIRVAHTICPRCGPNLLALLVQKYKVLTFSRRC
jgi:hypothetical protein